MTDQITLADLSDLIRNVSSFLKDYFESYFRDCKISGEVTIEI